MFGVAVWSIDAGMASLVFHHGSVVSAREVREPRHALPVLDVGLKRGVVSVSFDDFSGIWLRRQRLPLAIATASAVHAAAESDKDQTSFH